MKISKIFLAVALFACSQCYAADLAPRINVAIMGATPVDFEESFIENLVENGYNIVFVDKRPCEQNEYQSYGGLVTFHQMDFSNLENVMAFVEKYPDNFQVIINDFGTVFAMHDNVFFYILRTVSVGGKAILGDICNVPGKPLWYMPDSELKKFMDDMKNRKIFVNNRLTLQECYFDIPVYRNSIGILMYCQSKDENGLVMKINDDSCDNDAWQEAANDFVETTRKILSNDSDNPYSPEKRPELYSNYEKLLEERTRVLSIIESGVMEALKELYNALDDNDPVKPEVDKFIAEVINWFNTRDKSKFIFELTEIYNSLGNSDPNKMKIENILINAKEENGQVYYNSKNISGELLDLILSLPADNPFAIEINTFYQKHCWPPSIPENIQNKLITLAKDGHNFPGLPKKGDFKQTPEQRADMLMEFTEYMRKNISPEKALRFIENEVGCCVEINIYVNDSSEKCYVVEDIFSKFIQKDQEIGEKYDGLYIQISKLGNSI